MTTNCSKFKQLMILILAMLMLGLSALPVRAAENEKVRIEYRYVSESELSKDELSHLEKGLPKIKATKDANYLIVYKSPTASATNTKQSGAVPTTGDSTKILVWILAAPVAMYGLFKFRKKKAVSTALILCLGLTSVGLMTNSNVFAYENKNLKDYNKVQMVPIGTELFTDLQKINGYEMLGVIDEAKLSKPIPDNPNPSVPVNPEEPNPANPEDPVNPQVPTEDYGDGEFLGEASGRSIIKPVRVKVVVKNGKIVNINKQNENETIDDGGSWEEKGFKNLIKLVLSKDKNEQKNFINTMSQEMTRLFDIAFAIHDEGSKAGGKMSDFKAAFDKYLPGADASLLHDNMPEDEVVNITKLHLMKSNKYHQVDTVTGATYTGRGTINAIFNALQKTGTDITLKNFIIDGGIKYDYVDGDTLDLTNLKIKVEFKDGSTKQLLYDDFEKNGFSIMKIENKGKKVPIGRTLKLTESALGHPISHGVHLVVIHNKTNTERQVPIIRINPDIITVTPKKVVVRKQGTQDWLSSTTEFNPKSFVQKISLSKEDKEKLIDNPIEFGLIVQGLNNEEHTILLKPEFSQTDMNGSKEEKEYSLKVDENDLKKLNDKYDIQFKYWRLNVMGEESIVQPEEPQPVKKLKPFMIFMKAADDPEGKTKIPLVGKFDNKVFEFVLPQHVEWAKRLNGKNIAFEVSCIDDKKEKYFFEFAIESINEKGDDEYIYDGGKLTVSGFIINEDQFMEIDEDSLEFTVKALK